MISITHVDVRVTPVRTRLPFRYGIAEMTAAPHVVVEVRIRDAQGREARGWASEHLPPKWFTKNRETSFAEDLVAMVAVVEHAAEAAPGRGGEPVPLLWRSLDAAQSRWASAQSVPGLLAGLGTSLVERGMIDAFCRLTEVPFHTALHNGALGFDPAMIHPRTSRRGVAGPLPLP